jgi:DNA-binding transcriptional ArsR family regulator
MSRSATLIPAARIRMAARCLRVLAHPDRLRIVEQLDLQRRVRVGDLAVALDMAPNAVSQHLNQMRAHGLLDADRDGREVYYRIANPQCVNVLRCIRKHAHD